MGFKKVDATFFIQDKIKTKYIKRRLTFFITILIMLLIFVHIHINNNIIYSASGIGLILTIVITIKIMKALEKGLKFFKTNLKKFQTPMPKVQDYKAKFDLGARGNISNTQHNNITINVKGGNPKELTDALHKELEKMQFGLMGGK